MRGRKRFVQIDVHRIDAEIARAHAPDNGVEIGAITIEITAHVMQRIGNLNDVALEQAAGVWIGQHDGGHIVAQFFFERGQVHTPLRIGGNAIDFKAQKRRRGRICAMRRFWNQNAVACRQFALGFNRGANGHHAA